MKSIGEIAKIVDISVSTLRYYDEIGLLKPEYIDEESRYRYYTDEQIALILRILELKKYGFGLDAIKSLINEDSEQKTIASYESKIKELDCELKTINEAKQLLLNRVEIYKMKMDHKTTRVLLIDDSKFLRSVMKDFLLKYDYQVIDEASNGIEGINKYMMHKPDIVIMDIAMPELDGISATKKIIEFDSNARVLMCSAKSELSNVLSSLENGALNFIPKPFKPDHIIDALKRITNNTKHSDINDVKEVLKEQYDYNSVNKEKKLSLTEIKRLMEMINNKTENRDSLIASFISEIN